MAVYVDDVAEVTSLSAGQVGRLLRTLDLHRQMLQVGHEDARRLARKDLRPGYVLDFELIFRYMFRAEPRPDLVQELQYLFDCGDTQFLIGPGTQFEIAQFMYSAGFVIHADGTVEDLLPSGGRDRTAYGLDEDAIKVGVFRLSRLLESPNISHYSELMQQPEVDQSTFETAKAALDTRRRGSSSVNNNRSDALNLAAVVYLRLNAKQLHTGFHPYLLTATRPLLDESSWSSDVTAPVSRSPSDAIYTEILLEVFPDPVEAASHTVEVAFKAAALDRALRLTPAYLSPEDFELDPEWEAAVDQDMVTDELRSQLAELAEFVTDPVVAETQRIYDNARLASASVVQQRGEVLRTTGESPRKLFDLIVEVSAALSADRSQTGLADLWQTVLDLTITEHESRTTYALIDRGPHRRPPQYLVAEHYLSAPGDRDDDSEPNGQELVLRWPSSLDVVSVVDSFSRAFARHGVTTVDLIVGTDQQIGYFEASIPITLPDVVDAVCKEYGRDDDGGPLSHVRWVRMGSDEFDLYADVSPPNLTREPVVGVFVGGMNPEHLEDLYVRTSARYLLPAWLRGALERIRGGTEV